jgi:cyanophycinase
MHKRFAALAIVLTAALAQTQQRPEWPQPTVRGKLVVWGGDKAISAAHATFQLFASTDGRIVVVAKDVTAARERWKTSISANVVSSIKPEDIATASAVWLEVAPSPDVAKAVIKLKDSGGTVALSSELLAKTELEALLPHLGVAFQSDGETSTSAIVYAIDEAAVLVAQGRDLSSRGEGGTTLTISGGKDQPTETVRVAGSARADLIAVRRRAIERTLPEFPTKIAKAPDVKSGTLFIVGGGGLPDGIIERFIAAAGGPDAPIVYVPCEQAEVIAIEPSFVRLLRQSGAKNVSWIHTKDRVKSDKDEDFLKPLKDAKGVWFGGGRQWNLVDSYMDTQAHELMKKVLESGGAIGGSSAGASIQAEFLARGDPLGNTAIVSPGYTRGLGFLPGAAIDQHFSQRSRHKDMTQLMTAYPQLLGIGIDESTAIVVARTTAEVTGRGQVFFYDYRTKPTGETDYTALKAGDKYDMAKRKKIE